MTYTGGWVQGTGDSIDAAIYDAGLYIGSMPPATPADPIPADAAMVFLLVVDPANLTDVTNPWSYALSTQVSYAGRYADGTEDIGGSLSSNMDTHLYVIWYDTDAAETPLQPSVAAESFVPEGVIDVPEPPPPPDAAEGEAFPVPVNEESGGVDLDPIPGGLKYTDLIVEVRNKAYNVVGQIASKDLNLTARDVINEVGSWSIILADTHPLADALTTTGSGLVITHATSGYVLMSGPTTDIRYGTSADAPAGTLTISGVSDTVAIFDRLAYPDPETADARYQTRAWDKRSATCESLMHAFVRVNCGPDAPSPRRIPELSMGYNGARGETVTKRVRFHKLGTLLRKLGLLGNLSFRCRQQTDGTGIVFETWARRDKTAIQLSVSNGKLASGEVAITAHGVSRAVIAGGGSNKHRMMGVAHSNASDQAEIDWNRRIERFIDARGIDEWDELSFAGHEPIDESGFTGIVARAVAQDDSTLVYGTHWLLGDRVTVVVGGNELPVKITGWVLQSGPNGTMMGMTFNETIGARHRLGRAVRMGRAGSPFGGFDADAHYEDMQWLDSRLENLEVNSGNEIILEWDGETWPDRPAYADKLIWTGPEEAGPPPGIAGDHWAIANVVGSGGGSGGSGGGSDGSGSDVEGEATDPGVDPGTPGGGGGLPPSEPGSTLFGYNTNDSNSPLSLRQTWFDDRAPVVRRYNGNFVPASFPITMAVAPEKRVSYSFKSDSTYTVAGIAAGSGNTRFKAFLRSIPTNWVVYLTYYHEVNDDIRKGRITSTQFKQAYNQLYGALQEVIAAGDLNSGVTVRMCANFMAYNLDDTTGTYWSDLWVPNSMDLLTFDIYGNPGEYTSATGTNVYGTGTGQGYGTTYPLPSVRCAEMFSIIQRTGWAGAWGILEYNTPARTWDTDESSRADWLYDFTEHLLNPPGSISAPELVLLWEAPSGVNWQQHFGRYPLPTSGWARSSHQWAAVNTLKPYITGSA